MDRSQLASGPGPHMSRARRSKDAPEEPSTGRLMVGIDGSPCSLHALQWASEVGRRAGFDVVAIWVLESVPNRHSRSRRTRDVEEWCATLRPRPATSEIAVVEGDPAALLLEEAAEREVDLLVVGSRGAGGFAHLQLGSVAHYLTHHTTLPLAVVPATAPLGVHRLVVGVEGSPGAAAAVELTARLACALDAPVTAVCGLEACGGREPEPDRPDWIRRAEVDMGSWAAPVEKAGVPLEVCVDAGRDVHPVSAIERVLSQHWGSVAVLGTRGLGGFSGLRLGRVPLELLDHTGETVIVVPPPAAPADGQPAPARATFAGSGGLPP